MAIYGSPIMMGGGSGGGDVAFINAKFPSQTTSHTLKNSSGKVIQPVEDSSTEAIYAIDKVGDYTFTSSTSAMTRTTTVNVTALHRQYSTATAYDLASASWTDISNVAKLGLASNFWSVNERKNASVAGVSYEFAIMGFNNYDVVDSATYGRSKNGITFGMVNCMNTNKRMNSSNTNAGGWGSSEMKQTCNGYTLDSALSNVLVYCKIPYCGTYNSGTLSYDTSSKLFLPSYAEVYGNQSYSYEPKSKEGSQFAYYANGGSKVKAVSGSASYWWLRSVYSSYNNSFCRVTSDGSVNPSSASITNGCAPCFCV